MQIQYLLIFFLMPTFLCGQETQNEKEAQKALKEVTKRSIEAQKAAKEAEIALKKAKEALNYAEKPLRCCRPFKDYLHSFYVYCQLEEELNLIQKRHREQDKQSNKTFEELSFQIEDLQIELREKERLTKTKGLRLVDYIAFQSTKMDDINIQSLLAKEAHYLNLINDGSPQNSFVYEAIYKAFKELKTANNDPYFNTFKQLPEGKSRVGRFRDINIDKEAKKIYTIGSDGLLLKWDFNSYGKKETTKPKIISDNLSVARTLDRSPDGKHLAIAGDGDCILIYKSETGQLSKKLPHNGNRIWALKYTHSGDGIITAEDVSSQNNTRTTTIYYTNMKAQSTPIVANIPQRIASIELSSCGKYLAGIGSSSEVWIWDILNQRLERSLNDPESDKRPTAMAFDPRGNFLAVGYQNGALMIWDLVQAQNDSTYLPERLFRHKAKIADLVFNQDGTLLAVGSLDKSASLWHIRDKKYLGYGNHKEFPYQGISYNPIHLEDHEDWVTTVAFSPDETKVITGTANGKMKIWEIDMTFYANQFCSFLDPAKQKLSYSNWTKYMAAYTDDPEEKAFFFHLFTQRNEERCP